MFEPNSNVAECTCKVCGKIFAMSKGTHYVAVSKYNLLSMPTYYDAFDCPWCGCQNIVGERYTCLSSSEEEEMVEGK